jgi:hypothetical protein
MTFHQDMQRQHKQLVMPLTVAQTKALAQEQLRSAKRIAQAAPAVMAAFKLGTLKRQLRLRIEQEEAKYRRAWMYLTGEGVQ